MNGDPVRLVPNIPPIGLRDVAVACIVCDADLETASVRYPLRLKLCHEGRDLPALLVGYSCNTCYRERRAEVRTAQFLAAHRYMHAERSTQEPD